METLETLTGRKSNQLTLFAEDFPANPLVSPGNVKGRTMLEICGRSTDVVWKPLSPVGCLVKMCLAQSRTLNPSCSLTWKPLGTKPPYWGFRLAPSGHRTDANGSGLWGTPRANNGAGNGKHRGNNKSRLEDQVHDPKMWPTPRANKPEGYSSERFRPTLAQEVTGQPKPLHGQLNPMWVEWLMGYPIGWTDLEG